MCTLTFQLPAGLSPDLALQLERSCLAGGPDNMPYATVVQRQGDMLLLTRNVEESGYLVAPWQIEGMGQLMGASATLMQRQAPYQMLVELARGKVNQVRSQAADWQSGGLTMPDPLRNQIHQAALTFGRAVCSGDTEQMLAQAQQALRLGYETGSQLVAAYVEQVFRIRHQRQDRLDTVLSCPLDESVFTADVGARVRQTFNRVSLPMSWHQVECDESRYRWDEVDRLLEWAEDNELDVIAGPLIDFSSSQLPAWLWLWERELTAMATFMCRFVEAAVRRYRARIRRWQLTAATNWASVLRLSEDELLGLTFRLGETVRQVDSALELVVGVSQPWGEYMVPVERTSPFIFADNLIRSGLNLAGLNLEVVMGVDGRGSYCRDMLELSRLLDLYALLGVPLHVTLGYPTASGVDSEADPELRVGAGYWRGGFTPEVQAEWARAFTSLALCKPYVQTLKWVHLSDGQPHLFPACGLIDGRGQAQPALTILEELRTAHLR